MRFSGNPEASDVQGSASFSPAPYSVRPLFSYAITLNPGSKGRLSNGLELDLSLRSCAWETTPHDRANLISRMTDLAASDNARCQSSGAALGSRAYKGMPNVAREALAVK
jgi:hypothetical protein